MFGLATIREWTRYSDWANARLLAVAVELPDAALDRDFPMGLNSLRRTLLHIFNAEFVWRHRQQAHPETPWPSEDEPVTPLTLQDRFADNARQRDAFFATLAPADLARVQNYRDSRGTMFKAAVGDMFLQCLCHSTHHRAQVLNMFRHVGAALPQPELDYIFLAGPKPLPPGIGFDVATLRRFLEYADQTQTRLLTAAAALADEQLDQHFDMGVGTLRQTLLHIRFADQWWLNNWTLGAGEPFPELPPNLPVCEIMKCHQETAAARSAYLQTKSDADLSDMVEVEPRPGIRRSFPLGVTLLQICNHGIHHRAQASNMLRRLGAPPFDMDFMYATRLPAE